MKHRMFPVVLFVAAAALVTPTYCWAYVDPNTVGFVSQFLAPLGTLLVSCLIYFRRKLSAGIRAGWRWLKRRPPGPSSDETMS
jgi:hypothetical protein